MTKKAEKKSEDTAPHDCSDSSCPECGQEMKRHLFRTGSVQHPGRDMEVCVRCGTRK